MDKKTLAPVGGSRFTGFGLQRWLAIAVCFTLVMACAFLPTPPPTASATPEATALLQPTVPPANATQLAPADTAFGAVLAKIGPHGEVTPEMALEAFALAVAPLPGVTPPAGPPGDLDADLAVAWVARVRDQLSPDQQAAIDAA